MSKKIHMQDQVFNKIAEIMQFQPSTRLRGQKEGKSSQQIFQLQANTASYLSPETERTYLFSKQRQGIKRKACYQVAALSCLPDMKSPYNQINQ